STRICRTGLLPCFANRFVREASSVWAQRKPCDFPNTLTPFAWWTEKCAFIKSKRKADGTATGTHRGHGRIGGSIGYSDAHSSFDFRALSGSYCYCGPSARGEGKFDGPYS